MSDVAPTGLRASCRGVRRRPCRAARAPPSAGRRPVRARRPRPGPAASQVDVRRKQPARSRSTCSPVPQLRAGRCSAVRRKAPATRRRELDAPAEHVTVARRSVPDDQPAGTYACAIRDEPTANAASCRSTSCRRNYGSRVEMATVSTAPSEKLVPAVLRGVRRRDARRCCSTTCRQASRAGISTTCSPTIRGAAGAACARACASPPRARSAARTTTPCARRSSIELLHNALLVHDDIEDESEERRGRPTLHAHRRACRSRSTSATRSRCSACARCSTTASVLGPRLALRILEEAERMARESAEGQAHRARLAARQRHRRHRGRLPRDGAQEDLLVRDDLPEPRRRADRHRARPVDLDRFIRFGFFLGAAFQIQDDLLNLVGDRAATARSSRGDIWEGKRTLMLIHLFEQATPGRAPRACDALLGRPRGERCRRRRALGRASAWTPTAASTTRGRSRTGSRAPPATSSRQLYDGLPDSRDKRFIEALPTWVIERD